MSDLALALLLFNLLQLGPAIEAVLKRPPPVITTPAPIIRDAEDRCESAARDAARDAQNVVLETMVDALRP